VNSTRWIPARRHSLALIIPLLAGCSAALQHSPLPTAAEIPALETHVAAQPADAAAAVRLARAYRAFDRVADARPLLESTIARHPGDDYATFLLGLTYEDLGMYAEARQVYRSYIQSGSSTRLRAQLERRMPLLQRRELEAGVRAAVARERALADTPPEPFTIAVLPYEFLGSNDDLAPIGRALAELLVTDLAQTTRLRVLERARVQLLLDELRLAQSGRVDPATAARTGRILGAERVVHGSLDGGDAALQLETTIVRITDAPWPGEAAADAARPHLLQLSDSDRLQQLIAMQKRLALRIYSSLGIQLTEAERARVTRQPTENVMALLAFGRGLEREDRGDFAAAARHFAEAAALDPGFAAARESAERVTATAAAAATDTRQLAAQADAASPPAPAPAADDFFLPNPVARDPAAEILRMEGVSASPTVLEIIFRRQ
jgi:tetratricopeptide (TPR) repeat protein